MLHCQLSAVIHVLNALQRLAWISTFSRPEVVTLAVADAIAVATACAMVVAAA